MRTSRPDRSGSGLRRRKCPPEGGPYIPMMSTNFLTAAADFFSPAPSSGVSLISTICSIPRDRSDRPKTPVLTGSVKIVEVK